MCEASLHPDLRGRLRSFIESRFPLARSADLDDDASLLDAGAVDSLGILDVVAFLEQEFGVQIQDDDLNPQNFESVSALARFVLSKGSG